MFAYTWSALNFRLAIGLLAIGGLLAYFGYQEWKLASASSAGPQDLTVEELLARGPDGNPHVRLKNFKLGEQWEYYQYEDANDWSCVYVPALPKGSNAAAAGAGKVIVVTNHARNEQEFATLRTRATLTGTVVSAKDLGDDYKQPLAADYPGTDFDKSVLLQEGRQPSSQDTLVLMLGGGVGLVVGGGGLLAYSFTGNSNTAGACAPAGRGPTPAEGGARVADRPVQKPEPHRPVGRAAAARRGAMAETTPATEPGGLPSAGPPPADAGAPSPTAGRLCLVLAAVLWSTSGAFTKLLTKDTGWGLDAPALHPLQIACGRALFAGLSLLPLLRRRDLSFRPAMIGTALCFATMNALYVTAMAVGSAAVAVLLQYTAPMWMVLFCVVWLREPADHRTLASLAVGFVGVVVISAGVLAKGEEGGSPVAAAAAALGSGVAYAGVLIGLRLLRGASPRWLTVVNHLTAALALVPLLPFFWPAAPSLAQLATLILFGSVQMALPYWLAAHGLRRVGPQEAGVITLIEPVLNPLWAFLAYPQSETPTLFTLAGGACIVGALAWRYWPAGKGKGERGASAP
jgi:drug/metabolite transporter (DMT)-like permease